MQRELSAVKTDMADLKGMMRRIMMSVAKLAGEVSDLKDYLKENMATKSDISALNKRMDGFSGLLEESRLRWAVHSDTLARHDARLTKLERKPS
jgi:cob(I)alamin adenosyltransferase